MILSRERLRNENENEWRRGLVLDEPWGGTNSSQIPALNNGTDGIKVGRYGNGPRFTNMVSADNGNVGVQKAFSPGVVGIPYYFLATSL